MNSLNIRVSSEQITGSIIPYPSLVLSKHSSEEVKPSKLLCMKTKLKNTLSTSKLKCHSLEVTGIEQYKLPEGKTIEHLYKIYEIIGEGTTSVAKRAISTLTGTEVVLKIFRTNDQELLLNILQEYELQSSLDHPNIVKAFNFHYDSLNSKAYIVLEYVKGMTLNSMIDTGMLDEAKALSIFWQCINALTYMHRNCTIHRDLQPCNVLISYNGIAKLADFSVATKMKPYLFLREGTMDFMSPEVLKGESYNEKIDLWSMGILLYMMVVGQYPFPKDRYSYHLALNHKPLA
jgi:serine/threonine protein kinase